MTNNLSSLELGIKELQVTLGKMELALGSINEAIVWTGEDGKIQWCNTAFDRLVNRMHLAVLGCALPTLLPLAQAGTALVDAEHPVYQVLSHNFQTEEYEFQRNENILVLEISGSFFKLKNGDRTAVLTIRDVTERKRMEEALISANQVMSIYLQEVDQVIGAAPSVENNTFQPESLGVVAARPDELGRLARVFTQMVLQSKAREAEISILNEKLKSENLRMRAELDILKQMQQMILPKPEELNIEGLDIAGFMEPADEVGGDYYDVLQHNGRVKIGIGDITGHGLESGVLMIMVQTAVRTLLEHQETGSTKFLSTLNRVIYNNAQRMNSHKTLSLALLDYHAGCVSLSGQHEEMIVIRADGRVERIDTDELGFPLGLVTNIDEFIGQTEVQLKVGDGVVLYTDGIIEAKNSQRQEYGLKRLCQVLSQHWQQSVDEIRQAVIADVQQHVSNGKLRDDITLLVIKQK